MTGIQRQDRTANLIGIAKLCPTTLVPEKKNVVWNLKEKGSDVKLEIFFPFFFKN
jgi:hypothetical protein